METPTVTLVIPGRNCEATIAQCLEAIVPMLDHTPLREIIFVDDGSTDRTPDIVADFPVRCIPGGGRGPGAARNVGWREARHPLVWFVDSDCVAQPGALERLLPQMADPKVGGVSGSYGIMNPQSLLACLIHEEIIQRHRSMPLRVNFLATFNVLYRRDILQRVDGFDERYLKAQDAELSFRVMAEGYDLAFEGESRVRHYHPTRLFSYLRTQRHQGYWRVWLHMSHRGHATGDSYSSIVDHAQPPLAMLFVASVPLTLIGRLAVVPAALLLLLLLAQLPLTMKLMLRRRQPRYAFFAPMSLIRAFWRGFGMTQGLLAYLLSRAEQDTQSGEEN